MSGGGLLYLVMATGSATIFALALAYYSHQTGRGRRDQIVLPAQAAARPRVTTRV